MHQYRSTENKQLLIDRDIIDVSVIQLACCAGDDEITTFLIDWLSDRSEFHLFLTTARLNKITVIHFIAMFRLRKSFEAILHHQQACSGCPCAQVLRDDQFLYLLHLDSLAEKWRQFYQTQRKRKQQSYGGDALKDLLKKFVYRRFIPPHPSRGLIITNSVNRPGWYQELGIMTELFTKLCSEVGDI